MAISPSLSNHYTEYAQQLIQLHELIKNGEGDSDRADELRDTMDESWCRLTAQEIDWMRLLSADLNTLGMELPASVDRATDDSVLRSIYSAIASEDWEEFATLFRQNSDCLPPGDAAIFRSLFWIELGCFVAALPFLQDCVRILKQIVILEYNYLKESINKFNIELLNFWIIFFCVWGYVPMEKLRELEQRRRFAKSYIKAVVSLRRPVMNLEKLAQDLEEEIRRQNSGDNSGGSSYALTIRIKGILIKFHPRLSAGTSRLAS